MPVNIHLHGKIVRAQPIGRRSDGLWVMRVLDKIGRIMPGTRVAVDASAVMEGELPAIKTGESLIQSEEE